MLEHPRAGQRAVLGDVPDEDHGDAKPLGDLHHGRRDLTDLRDRACGARQLRRDDRLHRVDHRNLGPLAPRASPRRSPGRSRPRPECRARHLRSRWARNRIWAEDSSAEKYRTRRPAATRLASAIVVSVDLPIPGAPPISTSDPGTRPPPSTNRALRSRSGVACDQPRRRPAAAPASPPTRRRAQHPPRDRQRLCRRRPFGSPPRACSTLRSRGTGPPTGGSRNRRRCRRERRRIGPYV